MRTTFAAVAAWLVCSTSGAWAGTIDFEPLTPTPLSQSASIGFAYAEDGYKLSATGSFGFVYLGPPNAAYTGSNALFSNSGGAVVTLARADGASFSLFSIDLAPLSGVTEPAGVNVIFTGQKTGGGTAGVTFNVVDLQLPIALQTFTFGVDFANLTSVSWIQGSGVGNRGPYHQFDNIEVAEVASVPDHGASFLMLGGALTSLMLIRRRYT
jgi:hypothetical protein